MEQVTKLMQEILSPSDEFTPIPFWFLNDEPDVERIAMQLADYVEKGVNGIVLHPSIGVPESVPYLSERYFQAVRFIVKTASELGMKVMQQSGSLYLRIGAFLQKGDNEIKLVLTGNAANIYCEANIPFGLWR